MGILAAVLIAIVLFGLAGFVYFQLTEVLPHVDMITNIDWGNFGNFMAGVVGPLLLFIILLMMIALLRQQAHYFAKIFDTSKQLEMMRHLGKIDEDITRLLSHEFAVDHHYVQLGDLVDGLHETKDTLRASPSYRAAMNKLLQLAATYCEAIGLYRNDLASQFTFNIHLQRGYELHSYLERNREVLSPMTKQALSYCKMHLDGRHSEERKPAH